MRKSRWWFTDLVGFSEWALRAGDDAMLRLLRWVAQVVEPPLLEAGGQVVKRMGDGIMAVFHDPVSAITASASNATTIAGLGRFKRIRFILPSLL